MLPKLVSFEFLCLVQVKMKVKIYTRKIPALGAWHLDVEDVKCPEKIKSDKINIM